MFDIVNNFLPINVSTSISIKRDNSKQSKYKRVQAKGNILKICYVLYDLFYGNDCNIYEHPIYIIPSDCETYLTCEKPNIHMFWKVAYLLKEFEICDFSAKELASIQNLTDLNEIEWSYNENDYNTTIQQFQYVIQENSSYFVWNVADIPNCETDVMPYLQR